MQYIEHARQHGGIIAVYAHHYGDDDDSFGDINYGAGGMTDTDLEWLVDLVRANGGAVMTFGDALAYYRARSTMVDIDGDYVWIPSVSGAPMPQAPRFTLDFPHPNPFNPVTRIGCTLAVPSSLQLGVFDSRGRLIKNLAAGFLDQGYHEFLWQGLDERGSPAASGVYFVRGKIGQFIETRAVTLIK